jgi:hypothetical protein
MLSACLIIHSPMDLASSGGITRVTITSFTSSTPSWLVVLPVLSNSEDSGGVTCLKRKWATIWPWLYVLKEKMGYDMAVAEWPTPHTVDEKTWGLLITAVDHFSCH